MSNDNRVVCDRWGNWYTTTSYNLGNRFCVDAYIEYHYLTEEEVEEQQRKEERRSQKKRKRREAFLKQLLKSAPKYLTTTQGQYLGLYLQYGDDYAKIAEVLGVSVPTVRAAFEGNSRGQGGIFRKIRKKIGSALKNYL